MNKMILANLVHRPVRSLISIVAVAVEVTLILVIVGILLGILNDTNERQRAIGADVMVRPPGSSSIMNMTSAPVSVKVADIVRKIPHAKIVVPVVLAAGSSATETIWGIDPEAFDSMGAPFRYISGGAFQHPDDLIVDDYIAREKHLKVGDHMEVLAQDFRICGIVEAGKGGRKFVPMAMLQELIGAPGKATIFFVKLDTPANYQVFKSALLQVPGMAKYYVVSTEEYATLMRPQNLRPLDVSIKTVMGVAVVIGFIVIFQSMYTAVMERTREIGVLKSLGASKLYIVDVVLRETILLATLGVTAGIGLSYGVQQGLKRALPTLTPTFDPHWVLRAAIVGITGALLGAAYPAYLAAQKDPIDALAYE